MKYDYDQEGLTFYYFFLTLLGLYVVPTTLQLLFPKRDEAFKDSVQCTCADCKDKQQRKAVLKKATAPKFAWLSKVFVAVGWILLAVCIKAVIDKTSTHKMYDPFEVLGIASGANEKVIKKAYKIMSLKWHPDKAKDAAAKELNNARFVEITRAYKTLTDEKARQNWEEFGNPDGPTTLSLGIALPSWLVEGRNSMWVLLLYGAGFGLLVPWLVSRSWNGSKKYTKDRILHTTMALFYRELRPILSLKALAELIATASEFSSTEFPWTVPLTDTAATDTLLAALKAAAPSGNAFETHFEDSPPNAHALRVYALLFAHFHRIRLPSSAMESDQVLVVARAVHLTNGILKIAFVREWTAIALNGITLSQFLVQACWEKDTPLIQLPGFTTERCAALRTVLKDVVSVRNFLETPEERRRDALMNAKITSTEAECQNIVRVAQAFPDANVLDVKFQILGQDDITPGGIVTCIVKLKLSRMEDAMQLDLKKASSKARQEHVELEQFEFDEDGNMIERSGEALRRAATVDASVAEQPIHAPFYAAEKRPFWWVMLTSPDLSSFMAQPVRVTDLAGERAVSLQFPAPNRIATCNLRLLVRSDSLFGADIMMETKFAVVKEKQRSLSVDSDWGISDSESDSGSPFGRD